MGPCMGVVFFLLHMVHVVWIRMNRCLAGSKLPKKNAHGIVIIGDSLAEGIGDYVTLGKVPGLARHLQEVIRASPRIRRPKHWFVRSAGVAGSTSTSWLPPGAPRAPSLAADAASPASALAAVAAPSASGSGGGAEKRTSGRRDQTKGVKKSTKKEKGGKKQRVYRGKSKGGGGGGGDSGGGDDDKDDAGFRRGQLWEAALGPHGRFRHADIVVVAVGSNDFRYDDSRDPDVTRHNLSRICQTLVAMGKQVFVVGLRRPLHVKDAVNLHRNALLRDYCNMAESVGVDQLHFGPNLHVGSWEHARLNTADRQNFNSAGYDLLAKALFDRMTAACVAQEFNYFKRFLVNNGKPLGGDAASAPDVPAREAARVAQATAASSNGGAGKRANKKLV